MRLYPYVNVCKRMWSSPKKRMPILSNWHSFYISHRQRNSSKPVDKRLLRIVGAQKLIYYPCNGRTQNGRYPKQPKLRQKFAACKNGLGRAAGRVNRGIGNRNADEVNKHQTQTNGQTCKTGSSIFMGYP